MGIRVQSKRHWAMASGALSAAAVVLGLVAPAGAVPPVGGTEATVYIFPSGETQLQATCSVGTGPVQAGPDAFGLGGIAGFGVSVCDANAADATPDGASFDNTDLVNVEGALFTTVSASCTKGSATTGGTVTAQSGVVGAPFTSTATQTVTTAGGTQLLLNEVVVGAATVTRNAIRVLNGPNAGAIIGQVICPLSAYPLAVDTASPAGASLPFTDAVSGGSGSASSLLLAAGVAALLISQVGVALWMRQRRAASARLISGRANGATD